VLLDPPLTDKLAYRKDAGDAASAVKRGVLGQLRHDLTQVLVGRADDIPNYPITRAAAKAAPGGLPLASATKGQPGDSSGDASVVGSRYSKGSRRLVAALGTAAADESGGGGGDSGSAASLRRLETSGWPAAEGNPPGSKRPPRRQPPYTYEYRSDGHANWDF
jgi:hypothetical protein